MARRAGGVSSVAANDLAAMRTPAKGGLGGKRCIMPPQSLRDSSPRFAGEHACVPTPLNSLPEPFAPEPFRAQPS